MELITEIPETIERTDITYEVRKAARTVLVNEKEEMALLYVSENNYHKLPGGGIEPGESVTAALRREVKEEVGAEINILEDIGVIIEYRDGFGKYPTGQVQVSYCYYSQVSGKPGRTSFTDKEAAKGFKLKWVPRTETLSLVNSDQPESCLGQFIQQRESAFIAQAEKLF